MHQSAFSSSILIIDHQLLSTLVKRVQVIAEQLVSCYQCEADQDDCNVGSCQGKYCLFTRTQSSSGVHVKKSCTNTDILLYVDNVQYTSFGNCEYRQVNSVNYDYKLCNSSYCNTACPTGPFPSQLSGSASIFSTMAFSATLVWLSLTL
ncbi:hypothetical protein COOONC_12584 [Cooperia oncophora]